MRIKLMDEQKKPIKQLTAKETAAIEITAEELQSRIGPRRSVW